jgi:hypothetical protein
MRHLLFFIALGTGAVTFGEPCRVWLPRREIP